MVELRINMKLLGISIGLVANGLLLMAPIASGQELAVVVPQVAHTSVPYYPPLARVAHLEGVVHIRVTTDGLKVIAVKVEDGPKLLQDATEKTVQSWEFYKHEPTSFEVIFRYKIVDDPHPNLYGPTVLLRLPLEVEVSTTALVIGDPAAEVGHDQPKSLR
jgi:hypothetical protein